jgi:formate dehydrogenase subunit gamma
MELFQWGTDPWGQEVLVRASWDLLYLAFWGGIAFILFHMVYVAVWVPKLAGAAGGESAAGASDAAAGVPDTIVRHSAMARAFHWVMAASMLALLITGFLPILGFEFSWLTIHWVAGVVLTISIIWHMIHATFFLDFWSIWIGPKDIAEAISRTKRQLGGGGDVQKHGKYPLDHKLYHTAVMIAGLVVIASGLFMLVRIDTPLIARDAYMFADATWGLLYSAHGVSGVLFVTLTLTHVYFAIRPDKIWLTKSMLFGTVDKAHYLSHHDPKRWVVTQDSSKG